MSTSVESTSDNNIRNCTQ